MPVHLHEHIEVVQPTTAFARLKSLKSTIHSFSKVTGQIEVQTNTPVVSASGISVDPSCNNTITVTCLKELYNASGVVPSATINNSFGITGYLGQFANFADLQSFYELEVPEAVNTSFNVISVAGKPLVESYKFLTLIHTQVVRIINLFLKPVMRQVCHQFTCFPSPPPPPSLLSLPLPPPPSLILSS